MLLAIRLLRVFFLLCFASLTRPFSFHLPSFLTSITILFFVLVIIMFVYMTPLCVYMENVKLKSFDRKEERGLWSLFIWVFIEFYFIVKLYGKILFIIKIENMKYK